VDFLRKRLPAQVGRYLEGVEFPARKEELLGSLERNGVPGPVLGQLRKRLPEGEYRGPQDVLSALRRGRLLAKNVWLGRPECAERTPPILCLLAGLAGHTAVAWQSALVRSLSQPPKPRIDRPLCLDHLFVALERRSRVRAPSVTLPFTSNTGAGYSAAPLVLQPG
jgi:hypothetical protein